MGDPVICEATGESSYNVELSYDVKDQVHIEYGLVTEAGAKLLRKSVMGVHDYEKISEEEANEVLDDGDPIDSLRTPYKLQPHNQGHLIWFTGPPGTGKSTSAQLLAIELGYVYGAVVCKECAESQ